MYTIALRYTEKIAPTEGTIAAHQDMINANGYVWYGKLGRGISDANITKILAQDNPKILLIQSGGSSRYWAYVTGIKKSIPAENEFPEYYRHLAKKFKTWFCISRFEKADRNVMSKCIVASSRDTLSNVSKHSMSPFFFIEL